MATITSEQRREIEKAGDEPVRMEDPVTHQMYVVIREDVYRKLLQTMDQSDISLHEFQEFIPKEP